MISQNIIIIPLIHDWMWTADFQRQTGLTLKKFKNVIVAYELHKKDINLKRLIFNRPVIVTKKEGVYFFTPFHLIPFERFKSIYELNKKISVYLLILWVKLSFGFKKKIILWLFHPREVWLIKEFRLLLSNSFITIFDCVDYFAKGSTHEKVHLSSLEKKLVNEANVVTAISKNIQKYLKKMRDNIHLVPQGFRIHDFQKPKKAKLKIPKELPVIGYVGGLNDRIDFSLLIPLVKNNPDWKFVFWGPIQNELIKKKPEVRENIETLLSFRNVLHGRSKNKREIPSVISHFDICIIPYDISQAFNKYSYPMKLFEYFYMGKPVVSTPILDLKRFPKLVKIGKDERQWQRIISELLSKPWPKKRRERQRRLAQENSWEKKLEKVSKIIQLKRGSPG